MVGTGVNQLHLIILNLNAILYTSLYNIVTLQKLFHNQIYIVFMLYSLFTLDAKIYHSKLLLILIHLYLATTIALIIQRSRGA